MYYILALFYHKHSKPSIHGLWPQYDKNNWPEYCKPHETFDINKISDLLDELNKHWWSWNHNNPKFWEHEYLKHGTCGFNSEHKYFKTVLDCYYAHINNKKELEFNKHGHNIRINIKQGDIIKY